MSDLILPHPDQHYGCRTYSQHGEDLMVVNLFTLLRIKKPTYLDIGAHHPHDISNTRLLYERGSRGVNVEANPYLCEAFKTYRPDDIIVNAGVVPKNSKLNTLLMYSQASGRNTMSEVEAQKFTDITGPVTERLEIGTLTLNEVVDKYCGGIFPDFLSIDIEGLDYEVLNTTSFSKSDPLIVCAEVRRDDDSVMETMVESGFIPYCRCGENIIFIHGDIETQVY